MTPRPHAWTRRAAITSLLGGAGLLTLPGCDPRTLLYFLQPFEPTIPAAGPKLKGKKVVVLCHVSANAGADFADLKRDIARELTNKLRAEVKHITLVDPDKVAQWDEAHPTWSDPSEAAKDFEADVAIFLDVTTFQIEDPRDLQLMEGKSEIHIQVWEMGYPKDSKGHEKKNQPKEANKVYEEQADTTFPTRGAIPIDTGISRSSFKIKFMKLVATELSWHFVDHAPGDDIQDVKFNPGDHI